MLLTSPGQDSIEGYCCCVVYHGVLSLYYLWPGLCICQPLDQHWDHSLCFLCDLSPRPIETHMFSLSSSLLRLAGLSLWSYYFFPYHPEIHIRGGAACIQKVFFEGATCGQVFINSKMSFRTAEKHIVCTLILVGKSFPQCFCEHCLQTECWRCFCFWFSWVDTIKAISL